MEIDQQRYRGKMVSNETVNLINVGLKRFPVRQYRRHKVSTSSESSVSSTGNILNHLGVRIDKPGTKQALHIPTVEVVLVHL